MKIAVIGLWHLGAVTSTCLANLGFNFIAFDDDKKLISNYCEDILPIYEPRLKELLERISYHAVTQIICLVLKIFVSWK